MTILNISFKTTGPAVTKFHIDSPWADGRNVCSYNPGHLTNMTTMSVHGKNL